MDLTIQKVENFLLKECITFIPIPCLALTRGIIPGVFYLFIFSYQPIVLFIFRVERKQEKGGRDVTEYQIFVSIRELVVVNGSCVELTATGVVFPHEKITCEFSLHFSCWFQFYHTFLAYCIFYCQQISSIFPCFFC